MPGADAAGVAFVVPRYGADIVGGAETLCRMVAEHLADAGMTVEVFTTCAVDHFTWRDHHPPGTSEESGVTVHRFPVDPRRDHGRFLELHHGVARGDVRGYAGEVEWLSHSVASPAMLDALARRDDLGLRLAIPYLFGTTFWAVEQDPRRTGLIPCLHDEPYARLGTVRRMLAAARGCLANTEAEMALIGRVAPTARCRVGGVGFDAGDAPEDGTGFCADRGVEPGYLLYAGRREDAKGMPALYANYARYAAERPGAPALALMGTGGSPVPRAIAGRVVDLGYVASEDLRKAMAAARVFIHPSRLESLGMVLLEAWREEVPALVNARSPVLVDHCRRSGAGLWFGGYAEFAEALDLLLGDGALRARMGAAGRRYVVERYAWPRVVERYGEAVAEWA